MQGRKRDIASKPGLLHAFEREAKRSRLEHSNSSEVGNSNIETRVTPDVIVDPSSSSSSSSRRVVAPPFLPCHLNMLRSLYISDRDIAICEEMWAQITLFLSQRRHLVANNAEAHKLRDILRNAKAVSRKKSSHAANGNNKPYTGYNAHKAAASSKVPKTMSDTSLSFITQSQQLYSLTLNSPSKTAITQDTLTFTPFTFQNNRFENNMFQRRLLHGHGGGGAHNGIKNKNTTAINSMNLVTTLLEKRYVAAVKVARKDRDPFQPLQDKVQTQIQQLAIRRATIQNERRVGVKVGRGGSSSGNGKSQVMSARNVNDIEMQLKEMVENGFVSTDDFKVVDQLASIDSRLGLWKALSESLSEVLAY
mmetsp:Transcript_8528/g.12770  ORF Transcript_8528/g.12770 Transcript_8528/m.12770 type:complete len:364 (+) Transcript_8528:92-1183(+)